MCCFAETVTNPSLFKDGNVSGPNDQNTYKVNAIIRVDNSSSSDMGSRFVPANYVGIHTGL